MTTAIYLVTGMTCEHCVHAVTDELKWIRGVNDVTVTLQPGGHSAVTITSDAPLSSEDVEEALIEAGAGEYRLTS